MDPDPPCPIMIALRENTLGDDYDTDRLLEHTDSCPACQALIKEHVDKIRVLLEQNGGLDELMRLLLGPPKPRA